jgi:hypothetical protein
MKNNRRFMIHKIQKRVIKAVEGTAEILDQEAGLTFLLWSRGPLRKGKHRTNKRHEPKRRTIY